jgi:hypothetical protein
MKISKANRSGKGSMESPPENNPEEGAFSQEAKS